MITIDHDASLQEAMGQFLSSGNSRIPVIGEDADEVRGVLYLKDVAGHLFGSEPVSEQLSLAQVQREIKFVPESKLVSELLEVMQQESIHMAIVVDEYGGTAGLVTLEDLIEIVGKSSTSTMKRPELEELEPDAQGRPRYGSPPPWR